MSDVTVPPEIVEKAAKALSNPATDLIGTRSIASYVLAAVYGDIVEAARREFAGEVLRRLGAASVEQTEGIGNPPGAIMRTTYARAARIVAGLRDSEPTA